MLVVTRKKSERIRISDNIIITVVKISGDRVRLGIEAPAEIPIVRTELEDVPEDLESLNESDNDNVD